MKVSTVTFQDRLFIDGRDLALALRALATEMRREHGDDERTRTLEDVAVDIEDIVTKQEDAA